VRILVVTQYFVPEIGAAQTRLHTFAAGLAARGHDVSVVCEVPNHPQGVVHPGFGSRLVDARRLDGFSTLYVWVKVSTTKTMGTRLAFYASYAAMATAVGAGLSRPDVVFASSPPLPLGVAAALVAARHRVPWVLDVRDLWPDAAVAMGELRPGRALRAAQLLERCLYRSATAISTVTEPFRTSIAHKVGDPEKITLIPNGTTRFWLAARDLEPDRATLDLPVDRFIWTYVGHLGVAQGLEPAVDAANLLGDGYLLLIIGDGPVRRGLEARAREGLGAVEFRSQVDPDVARRYLRSSDALLVPLAADSALQSFVPSKLFDYSAVGRPMIVTARGEAQRIAARADAALAAAPGDPAGLAQAVRRLAQEQELRERLSAAGPRLAAANLRDHQIERLEALLARIAKAPEPLAGRTGPAASPISFGRRQR
jgi:colanic acid biosynthesis glycosyl transferase WcaI